MIDIKKVVKLLLIKVHIQLILLFYILRTWEQRLEIKSIFFLIIILSKIFKLSKKHFLMVKKIVTQNKIRSISRGRN
jgi:hypothetical protein